MNTPTSNPKRLAQYEIVEFLGAAGRTRTYKAVDTVSRHSVTLKTIARSTSDPDTAAGITQLQQQAKLSSGLRHPRIIRVIEYGEDANVAFLALESVEGCSLKPRLRVNVPDAVSIIAQLLETLEYAHGQGVVHLFIRPPCLLLTSKGEIRLTDFGTPGSEPEAGSYLSPEQLKGGTLDHRVDLFSCGAYLYELLTGKHPFAEGTSNLAQRICEEQQLPPSQVKVGLSGVFDQVCAKALSKEPEGRYANAREFREDLNRAFEEVFGSTVTALVSNETVVSVFLASLRGESRKPRTPQPHREPAPKDSSKKSISAWDEKTLRTVEQQLAVFVGPVARVIVKEAAANADDLDKLYEYAADSLGSPQERKAFLDSRSGGPLQSSAAPPRPEMRMSGAEATPTLTLTGDPALVRDPAPVFKNRIEAGQKPPEQQQQSEVERKPDEDSPVASPKPQAPSKVIASPTSKSSSQSSTKLEPKLASRLEELLGKQPENLAGYLRSTPPEVSEVIHAFVAVTDVLAARYATGQKAGGLTPENICFDQLGRATIRVSQATVPQGGTLGGAMGSPRYAAPEIFSETAGGAEGTVGASDIYSLGFMFYEILLGRELFQRTFAAQRSDLDWLRWHADMKSKAPSLKSLLPEHPAALSELLESMMAKDPGARLSDATVILSRLRSIAQQAEKTIVARKAPVPLKLPVSAKHPSMVVEKKPKRRLPLVLMIVILILAVCGLLVWQNPEIYRKVIAPFHHSAAPAPATP